MSTFHDRIIDYLGTQRDVTALSTWLTAGAKIAIDVIPTGKIENYTKDLTDSGTGISITTHRPIYAHKSNYIARKISAGDKAKATDSSSLMYATTKDPAWYITGGKAYVVPSGGTICALVYPTVLYSDSSIADFPSQVEHCAVLYCVSQGALREAYNAVYDSDVLTISTVNAPSTISAPSFTYTDASLGTYTETVVGSLGTVPTYTKPTITLETAPSDLNISSSAPVAPTAPSFTYTDATLGTYTSTTVGSLGTVPTYTKPTISLTSAPSALDMSGITIPSAPAEFSFSNDVVAPTAPTAPSISYTDAVIGTYSDTTTAMPSTPTYTKPTTTASVSTATTYIGTDEDAAKAAAELQKQSVLLEQFGKDQYNELNRFNGEIENLKVTVQHLLEMAGIASREMLAEAEKTTDLHIQNEIQTTAAAVQAYQATLGKYAQDLNRYQNIVNTEVTKYATNMDRYKNQLDATRITIEKALQEYKTNLEAWQIKRSTELQQYQSDIQNEVSEFQKELAIYQSTVQTAITNAQLAQQNILQAASDAKDLNLQNEAQTLAQQVQEYQAKLGKFNEELTLYKQNVEVEIQKYTINLQKWTTIRETQLRLYNEDIQNELNEFQKELAIYQSTVQTAITNAQLAQQRILQAASETKDLSMQNRLQALNRAVAEYQASLGKFQSDIQLYNSSVQKAIGEYSAKIQAKNSIVQNFILIATQAREEFNTLLKILAGA